jgi:diaminopropionate ammonia-lyase
MQMRSVEMVLNQMRGRGDQPPLDDFGQIEAARALDFHRRIGQYAPTPLLSLKGLASRLGLEKIFIKDESKRFGLNAFKALGGSYAMGRVLAEKLGIPPETMTFGELASPALRAKIGNVIFATATDGNHGRGVAWAAQQLGQRAVVFMPKGSAEARAANIRATGAECRITEHNYDGAVREAESFAKASGAVLIQDMAWDGYEKIPRWIMQGYLTMAVEIQSQLRDAGESAPTHVFLQAGNGSFPAAFLGGLEAGLLCHNGEAPPLATIVEPNEADCIYKSIQANDGQPRAIAGEMNTLMAGLACGKPSSLAWELIRHFAFAAASCPDCIAANGMRILAAPVQGDPPIVSGESGAAAAGLLEWLMSNQGANQMRQELKLGQKSRVLLISTEGDTSPQTYLDVVWHGKCPDVRG